MSIFKKSKPTNQIIDLSAEQKEDFFKCFIKYNFTMVETKRKLIDYAKMFINNQMSFELYSNLRDYNSIIKYNRNNYHIFKTEFISIIGRPYVIFYIDNFISITKVSIADEHISPEEINLMTKHIGLYVYKKGLYVYKNIYDNVLELNGYQLFYSVKEYSNNDVQKIKYTKYITFLLCKDGLVYIKNNYCFTNKELETTIIGSICDKKNKFVYDKLKLKTSGITKEELEDCLKSILMLQTLKDGKY